MKFRFSVVDFKKINLKGITRFCNKYDCAVKMSVKMDSNGIGIKIFDETRKCSISIYGVHQLTKEDKSEVLGDHYDDDDEFETTFHKCDHDFLIDAESEGEVRLAYLFAMYLASVTDIILLNLSTRQLLVTSEIKELGTEEIEKYAKQFTIREEYLPDIRKWSVIQFKAFKVPTTLWIGLIFLAIVAVLLLTLMIFVYEITNPWLLGSPFIAIGVLVFGWAIYNLVSLQRANGKLRKLYFEYESKLCELWDERMPKKPSGKIVGLKNKVVNTLGILILPTLILGSLLVGLEYLKLGAIVIAFPWVCLILIKIFITDVNEDNLYRELHSWLEECLGLKYQDEVIAANFDLQELDNNNWKITFVRCCKFDEKNSMWTRNSMFKEKRKEFTFKYVGCWEEVQDVVITMIKKYLKSQERTIKVRLYKAMTVGFNDGSVFLVYMNGQIMD